MGLGEEFLFVTKPTYARLYYKTCFMSYITFLFLVLNSLLQTPVPSFESYSSTLEVGQSLDFEGRSIRFKKLISDSRCPKGVTCIWAGEAKVLVEILDDGEVCGVRELTLSGASEAISLQKLFPGESISLLPAVLAPYPEIDKQISQEEYRLSLKVTVAKEQQ